MAEGGWILFYKINILYYIDCWSLLQITNNYRAIYTDILYPRTQQESRIMMKKILGVGEVEKGSLPEKRLST